MTQDNRPGLNAERLVTLMEAAIDRCQLNLSGLAVLTEAASGAYLVTPVLAAMAGARVCALSGSTPYATSDELEAATRELAQRVGVIDRVQLAREKSPEVIGAADIVTNSGQVRPIDAGMVALMKSSAVVPLMYESWEYRSTDLDLGACHARHIQVAGTNEAHPKVDFMPFLGAMAVKQLHDAGIAVYRSRIIVVCDNAFSPYLAQSLRSNGADVVEAPRLTSALLSPTCDAVLLAVQPGGHIKFAETEARLLREKAPGTVLVHYWGDMDQAAFRAAAVPVWPPGTLAPGHMTVLPSAVGPEPVVRLLVGGLKVGALLARGLEQATAEELALVQLM